MGLAGPGETRTGRAFFCSAPLDACRRRQMPPAARGRAWDGIPARCGPPTGCTNFVPGPRKVAVGRVPATDSVAFLGLC